MKTTARNPQLMKLSRLALLGLLAAGGLSWSARAGLYINVGTIDLNPNTAGQTVDLFIDNTGATAFQAQGLTLRLQVDDGLGGGNAPILTAVNAVTGTPWAGQLGSVNNQKTEPEFWDVRIFSDFFSGKYAELGPNSHTLLATVTFDTTGLTSGTWDFRLANFTLTPNPGDTKYNLFGTGNEFFPTVNNGQLTVVPEASTWLAGMFALSVAAFSGLRRGLVKG